MVGGGFLPRPLGSGTGGLLLSCGIVVWNLRREDLFINSPNNVMSVEG